jgi:hypothetical protein
MPPKEQSEPTLKTFQVWHEGKSHAVDVESVGVREVWTLTRQSPERWKDDPTVTIHADSLRRTKVGDVIVDPTCGAWEVQKDRFLAVAPPAAVAERMAREGIVPQHIRLLHEWTESMLSAMDAGQSDTPSREEFFEVASHAEHTSTGVAGYNPHEDLANPRTPDDLKLLGDELRSDAQAVRTRDYGPEDAATYDQRVREGAQMPVTDWQAEFGRMRGEMAMPSSDYQEALDAASRRGSKHAKEKGPER